MYIFIEDNALEIIAFLYILGFFSISTLLRNIAKQNLEGATDNQIFWISLFMGLFWPAASLLPAASSVLKILRIIYDEFLGWGFLFVIALSAPAFIAGFVFSLWTSSP